MVANKLLESIKMSHLKFVAFAGAIILMLLTSVAGADCINDQLVRMSGRLLYGASGNVYRIINTDGANIEFWLPPAGIVVCEQEGADGQLYISISNQDTNETVIAAIGQ